jgi:hypothetical protein
MCWSFVSYTSEIQVIYFGCGLKPIQAAMEVLRQVDTGNSNILRFKRLYRILQRKQVNPVGFSLFTTFSTDVKYVSYVFFSKSGPSVVIVCSFLCLLMLANTMVENSWFIEFVQNVAHAGG